MTEVLWPPDLVPSSQSWTTIGNAATFNSPFVGTTRTYGRPGVRMGCTITLPPVKGEPRARMLAALRALKDRGNYIWVPDFTTTLETGLPVRGSFAATELLPNNHFANGTTGLTGSNAAVSVTDRVLRATWDGIGTECDVYASPVSVTQYAPYALRSQIGGGSWESGNTIGPSIADTVTSSSDYSVIRGLRTDSMVVRAATTGNLFLGVGLFATTKQLAGSFYEVNWSSFARCALVDNGPNALLQSDTFDNASWTKDDLTVTANANVAPDGTTTADSLIEDSDNSDHFVFQAVTVVSSAADYVFSVAVKAGGRNFVKLDIDETTGGTAISQYFNLSTGAVGTNGATGANWSNRRAFITSLGNDWYLCSIVGRKTNAATTIRAYINIASADGTASYTGNGSSGILVWRASMAQSSVPVRGVQTTTTATTGTTQTSNRLYVKGLPASTSGLLKAGDMVQIGGQINQLTAPLDSNAAGLGVLICGNPWRSPADNAPVIVNTPMCKMQLASDTIDIETGPGQFSPFQLELVEVIE
jgi:hypothetical protein